MTSDVRGFHRSLPEYNVTPLVDLPDLARKFGVGRVFAKDESHRLGLPAFKALGASWAIHRALGERTDSGSVTLVTATDGNHGRAVAHFARSPGHRADIFIPEGVHPAACKAIRDEGATVSIVPGSYDDAVQAAEHHARDDTRRILVQDTAWEGYEEVPGWIVEGYSTLFAEIDEQLEGQGANRPDLVLVPSGVGSLLQAALTHYRSETSRLGTMVVSVEPTGAACVLAGVEARRPVTVETGDTVMAGLNCGTMSSLAWPYVSAGLDICVAVTDEDAIAAAHNLASLGIDAGPCGAAPLAALRVLHGAVSGPAPPLDLSPDATVVFLVTEGADANPWISQPVDLD